MQIYAKMNKVENSKMQKIMNFFFFTDWFDTGFDLFWVSLCLVWWKQCKIFRKTSWIGLLTLKLKKKTNVARKKKNVESLNLWNTWKRFAWKQALEDIIFLLQTLHVIRKTLLYYVKYTICTNLTLQQSLPETKITEYSAVFKWKDGTL